MSRLPVAVISFEILPLVTLVVAVVAVDELELFEHPDSTATDKDITTRKTASTATRFDVFVFFIGTPH